MKITISAGATLDVRPGVSLSFRSGVIIIDVASDGGAAPPDRKVTISEHIIASLEAQVKPGEWRTFMEILTLCYPKEAPAISSKLDPLYNKTYVTISRMVENGLLEFEKPHGRRKGRYRISQIQP